MSEEKTPPVPEQETASEADTREAARNAAAAMDKIGQENLESMKEEGNEDNDRIISEARKQLDTLETEFEEKIRKDLSPESIREELEKLKNDMAAILKATREKVIEVSQSEQFRTTMQAGADFLSGAGAMIAEGLQYGYDKLMDIPAMKKAAGIVEGEVEKLRRSRTLADIVSGAEKGLTEINQAVFDGLHKFFQPAQEKEDIPALPYTPEIEEKSVLARKQDEIKPADTEKPSADGQENQPE